MIAILFILVLSIGFLLVPNQVSAEATKVHVAGWMENPQWIAFGDVWVSNGNVQVRNRVVSWDQYATDLRLEGETIVTLNVTLFMDNPVFEAKMWGKFTINLPDGSYWEGSLSAEIVGGLQQGSGIAQGRGGAIDGLKVKLAFMQRAGVNPPIIDFEGTILNPWGE